MRRLHLLPIAGLVFTGACTASAVAPVPPEPTGVIAGIVANVMLPGYDSVSVRAARLSTALATLQASPSATSLAAARTAWLSSRDVWEKIEAYTLGPTETENFDPNMDTWPIDLNGVKAIIAGTDNLTDAYVDALDGTLKGYHGIEYVLWAESGAGTVDSLTPRRLQYAAVAGRSLAREAAALLAAWSPSGGDFAGQLTRAGTSGSIYGTKAAALAEIMGGVIESTNEVATSKIAQPLTALSHDYEESRFSDNSLTDFTDDIMSSQTLYFGGATPQAGAGLRALVLAQQPAIDVQVQQSFAAAFAALANVKPSFGKALDANPQLIRTAQDAVLALNRLLTNKVVPLVGAVKDTDD